MSSESLPGERHDCSDAARQATTLHLRFVGSAWQYFRISLSNALLVLATLGVLQPWAQRRRARYFASHTDAGNPDLGYQALEYRGHPVWGKCALILLALGLLGALTWLASDATQRPVGLLLVALLLVVWRWSRLQASLVTLYWRGEAIEFRSGLFHVCRVVVPAAIAVLLAVILPWQLTWPEDWGVDSRIVDASGLHPSDANILIVGLTVLWLCRDLPWRVLQYRQDTLVLAGSPLSLATSRRFQRQRWLWLLSAIALALVCVSGLIGLRALLAFSSDKTWRGAVPWSLLVPGFLVLTMIAWQTAAAPWLQARRQNLIWSHTASEDGRFQFAGRLNARHYALCRFRGWCLTVLTAGLYRPFAVQALMRMRIEAVDSRCRPGLALGGSRQSQAAAAPPRPDRLDRWVSRLLRPRAMLVLLPAALAVVVAASVRWTLPLVDRLIVAQVPIAIDPWLAPPGKHAGKPGLQASQQTEDEQARIRALLAGVVQRAWPAGDAPHYELRLGSGEGIGAAALVRPDGTIYLFDPAIQYAQWLGEQGLVDADTYIAGVFSHELGHVQQRVALSLAIRMLLSVVATQKMLGDVALLPGLALGLLDVPGYSLLDRAILGYERDADHRSAAILMRAGLSPCAMAKAAERSRALRPPGYQVRSTHPSDAEQARMFGQYCPPAEGS